ncbi:MAG TPA: exodeoxyribonuclease VII large subunit [Candidatus Limnocylindrales bacterium]|nr:exodeoxyribonuclease VII large subunit [Candidatus Limnocylindrales bacterium]
MHELVFSVSEFVAVLNQTLDFAYPVVTIVGELTNFRVSRGKWVYFDIKDDQSSVKCFGTVYMLPGPLEDGMMVRITASPRLHPLYNFSLNLQSITPVGEGSLRRAADLLLAKLASEGLFENERKRALPYAPEHIGLITSKESAAYADFVKILNERWAGVKVSHYDVQVQGEPAIGDIVGAIEAMNQLADPPEVLVITRGGGSAEDLAVFNTEQVTRAVAGSRIPTLVAIGHEVDLSLAELASDQRASTPSNAAQLLVPDKRHVSLALKDQYRSLGESIVGQLQHASRDLKEHAQTMRHMMDQAYLVAAQTLVRQTDLLEALNPEAALKRGYAIVRGGSDGKFIKSVKSLQAADNITITWQDGSADATISSIK